MLRIDGYQNDLAQARRSPPPTRARKDPSAVNPAVRQKNAPELTPIGPLTLEDVERRQNAAEKR